ncbi:MAG: NCS2 family nucleobase:cation symporter [Eggerthellaceae bacterium]|nr:NCS2 family nucleobase:cation symporter [Eggerthellaceae bacterium]MCH4220608.1 NCS2 family nucleobase:cation symporter [Eggerthellaceae bacterium]
MIGVDDRVSTAKAIPLALQHFMSMFGSTVLVPFLTGMSPSLAIMCSGIGTILYLLVTRGKIPSYLGSSFAFITPIIVVGASMGPEAVLGGIVVTGCVYVAVALLVKIIGTAWIDKVLPTPVIASVIIVIGLGLSSTAVEMAFFNGGYATGGPFVLNGFLVAMLTLIVSIVFSTCFSGFWSTIPVLVGIVVGYVSAFSIGLVDFQPVIDAPWVGLPTLMHPTFNIAAILLIAPVAFVVIIEHIGHLMVVGEIVGKNYNSMLPQSLLGDGLATITAGLLGGTPATTYSENIGVMSATRVYSTQIFWYAGAIAFLVGGFCPKIEALINSIPVCVMGGVSLLLFGLIASNGLRMLVAGQVDFSKARNLMLVSAILVIGVGMECVGVKIPLGDYSLPGMATAAVIGIVLNLILPKDTSQDDIYPADIDKKDVIENCTDSK